MRTLTSADATSAPAPSPPTGGCREGGCIAPAAAARTSTGLGAIAKVSTAFTLFKAIALRTFPCGLGLYLRFLELRRLQVCDPFAKGAHLPRGEPASRLPFRCAVVAELVDAQR